MDAGAYSGSEAEEEIFLGNPMHQWSRNWEEKSISTHPLQCKDLIEYLKETTNYMRSYSISDAEKEIFQVVLPVIIKQLDKVYRDNSSLIDNIADDEMINFIIKENLMGSLEMLKIIKDMLFYVTEEESIAIDDIDSFCMSVPNCMVLFFQHFKSCFDSYASNFHEEASAVFEEIQKIYLLFLRLLEISIVVKDKEGARLLIPAINFFCEFCAILSNIDVKLVYSGLKTLSVLSDKYAQFMQDAINLSLPINCVTVEVEKALVGLAGSDASTLAGNVKIINFFVKFIAKFCNNFRERFEKFSLSFICFYIKIFSFSLDRCQSAGAPCEALEVIEKSAYYNLEELLKHFLQLNDLLKVQIRNILDIPEIEEVCTSYPAGVLYFLNITVRIASTEKSLFSEVIPATKLLFSVIDKCYKDFFYEGFKSNGLFESLVVNISSAILRQQNCHNIERFLIEEILQENPIRSALAVDVYTVLLSYQNSKELAQFLINLLNVTNKLNIGKFSSRPEHIYLQILLKRIFKMLPPQYKMEVQDEFKRSTNYEIWKILGYENLSANTFIQQIVSFCRTGDLKAARKEQFMNIAECLEICSMSNYDKTEDLIEAICKLWGINLSASEWDVTQNMFLKYFISKLMMVTASCVNQFSIDQLSLIFTKLSILSKNETYLIFLLKILSSYFKDPKIPNTAVDQALKKIIMAYLNSESKLIRELCFDLLRTYPSFRQFFNKNVIPLLNENLKTEIKTVLNDGEGSSFDYDSVNDRFCFVHDCMKWCKIPCCQKTNDSKENEDFNVRHNDPNDFGNTKQSANDSDNHDVPNKRPKISLGPSKRYFPANADNNPRESEGDSISDVLKSLKGEVKCLLKATQKEKLSAKNASHLKIIIRDLSSLL